MVYDRVGSMRRKRGWRREVSKRKKGRDHKGEGRTAGQKREGSRRE